MNDPNLLRISIQDLYYFRSIVECRSMTAAAEKLYVTQPLLSRCVSRLEEATGVQLFLRSKRSLILTPAGELLYEECRELLRSLEDSVEKAVILQRESKRSFTLGVSEGINAVKRQSIAVQLAQNFPELSFRVVVVPYIDIRGRLLRGELDMAVMPDYEEIAREEGFRSAVISRLCMAITVSRSNPLYDRESLSWSDIREQPIVMPQGEVTPGYAGTIREHCMTYGFEPVFEHKDSFDAASLAVASGNGILVSLGNAVSAASPYYRTFYMEDSPVQLVLAYGEKDRETDEIATEAAGLLGKIFSRQI